jgi:hypothetical protein
MQVAYIFYSKTLITTSKILFFEDKQPHDKRTRNSTQSLFNLGKVNMELQLDATIRVLLISKISSICFGQNLPIFRSARLRFFTTYGTMSCYVVKKSKSCAPEDGHKFARNMLS